jgi:hypothetical protein
VDPAEVVGQSCRPHLHLGIEARYGNQAGDSRGARRRPDKHRAATARTLLDRLKDVIDEVNTVAGDITFGGIVTATEEAIDVAIRERLSTVHKQVLYPEIDLGEVWRALERVNAEAAPNGPKNQQMKDSLLWEACLSLAADYRVFFVTGDKAFYVDRDVRKGLAANLAAEVPVQQGRLKCFPR